MIAERLTTEFGQKVEAIRQLLEQSDLVKDESEIHGLRIKVKQLRALGHLFGVWVDDPGGWAKIFQQLQPIYSLLGKVREVQLMRRMIAEIEQNRQRSYKEFDEYLTGLHKKFRKELTALLNGLADKPIKWNQKRQDSLRDDLRHFNDARLIQGAHLHIQGLYRTARRDLRHARKDEEILHEVRRQLKIAFHIMQSLNKAMGANVWPKEILKELLALTDEAGDWHDRYELREYLADFRKQSKNSRARYRKLNERLNSDLKKRRKSLIANVEAYIQQHSTIDV